MRLCLFFVAFLLFASVALRAQNFQLLDRQDSFQGGLNESIRVPLRIKNTTEKAQFYIIRKSANDLGSSQKGYFCLNKTCLEPGIEEFSKKIEAGETLQGLYFVVETGLQAAHASVRFEIFAKGRPQEAIEHTVNVTVDETPYKAYLFKSKEITINEVFPNPVQSEAFMEYQIHQEQVKAKVIIHNILGKPMGEYELNQHESRVKILADELASGIYFYTVYLDNNGVATRKMIVRK